MVQTKDVDTTIAGGNSGKSPPPLDWEAAVGSLLSGLADVQEELLQVLQQKRAALAIADLPRLASLQPQEERLAQRLEECHQQRADLLTRARREGLPAENLGKLAARFQSVNEGDLGERVQETVARVRLLQHHSLTNWVLAQRSLLHVSQLLEIIATGGRKQPTYGDRESVHARGSLVDQNG